MTISAIIITLNEERNIGRCLESLKDIADEVIVVDSGSTDATESICLKHNAIFVHHPWEGYSGQKNYANQMAHCEWTLSLDADEVLSFELRESLLRLRQMGATHDKVYRMNRLTNYCGHFIRHCGWYPDAKIRLWPTGKALWKGSVHEEITFDHNPQVVTLQGDLLHYSYYSTSGHNLRLHKYAMLAAHKAYDAGRRSHKAAIVFSPMWNFFRNYILRLGFLDGFAGLVVCRMEAHYTFLKYTYLRQIEREDAPLL